MKRAQSMTMSIVIIAIIIVVFIAVSAVWSGKLPKMFSSITSPFDDTCCCDKTLTNCEIKARQECKQTIQPTETCTQRGIK
ncbi:hypothetical protein HY485_05325 [Candidatus Woesearchaeota archaeon]|nr:hypothetical protein [Candidatus Woesearchaeota archaeon]